MKRLLLSALLLGVGTAFCSGADFASPVRLKSGAAAIRVESPGFAAPCWAELDGKPHLLVGQFNDGKIRVFRHLRAENFASGEWLKAEGEVAEVPGVW